MSDIENIKKLRQSTGAGFKDCNLALKESEGNLEKAAEILRVKGIAKASKKMIRDAKDGVVLINEKNGNTSVIEINCETDFVAKNEDFISFVKEVGVLNNKIKSDLKELKQSVMNNGNTLDENLVGLISKIGEKITIGRLKTINIDGCKNYVYQHSIIKDNVSKLAVITTLKKTQDEEKLNLFGKQLSMHIAASNPLAINSKDISSQIIENEKKLISEELKNNGKPDEIIEKISLGKINKFKDENSLLSQPWVMEPKKKVIDIVKENGFDENIIEDFVRIKIGE